MNRGFQVYLVVTLTVLGLFEFQGIGLSASAPLISDGISETVHVAQTVRDKVQQEGRARVIVELRLPASFVPEGENDSLSAVAGQRDAIASIRSELVSKLARTRARVVHEYETVPLLALEVEPDALAELEMAWFQVTRVVEDELFAPTLAQSVPLVEADQAWARGFDGTGQVIAIIDTGVASTHPFLAGKVIEEACFSSNFPSANGSTLCPNGGTEQTGAGAGRNCSLVGCEHGTHVAGIAAGNGLGAGVTFSGVAKGASIMAVQVFSRFDNPTLCGLLGLTSPCILSFFSDQIKALERVFSLRAQHAFASANLSIGGADSAANCDGELAKPIIDNLRAADIATVIAAGNSGSTNAISKPACISSAVSVGSTTKSDTVSSFSNVAPFLSLFAPGSSVTSSVPGGFATFSGTSMAAPHVAGAWAIAKEAFPNATVQQILAALQQSGHPVTDTRPGGAVTKSRIRISAALTLASETFTLTVVRAGTGSGSVTTSPVGINCGFDCSESYTFGTVVTLLPIADPGSFFAGFTGAADCLDGVVMMDVDKSCTATFLPTFRLTVNKAGTAGGSVTSFPAGINCGLDCVENYNPGTIVTLFTAPEPASVFAGWSDGGCSGLGTCMVNMNADKTVTATFVTPLALAALTLPTGEAGMAYSAPLITGGLGPYTFTLVTGVFPPVLTFNSSNGRLTGTPAPGKAKGFTVQITDQLGSSVTGTFKITVVGALSISTKSLKAGTNGKPYKGALKAKGGATPYTWSLIGSLPLGLALDPSTGAITGTPTQAGIFNLTFQVTDPAGGSAQKALPLTIN